MILAPNGYMGFRPGGIVVLCGLEESTGCLGGTEWAQQAEQEYKMQHDNLWVLADNRGWVFIW